MSRNAATIELKESGDVILCSTHVNPVFYGGIDDEPKLLKNNKSIKLKNKDTFSLTPTNFKFQIEVQGLDVAKSTNGNSIVTDVASEPEELKNGNGESKVPKENSEMESEEEEKPKKSAKKQKVFFHIFLLRFQ